MGTFKKALGVVTLAALGIGVFEAGHTLPKLIQEHEALASTTPSVKVINWSPGKVSPFQTPPGTAPESADGAPQTQTASTTSVDATSLNWAGLVQQGSAERSVQATWQAPAFTSQSTTNPNSAVAEWVGLGGMQANSLIQVGTITTPNSSGQPVTEVFWEKLPASAVQVGTVPAGTSVTAQIRPAGTNSWRLVLTVTGQKTPLIDQLVTLTPSQAQAVEQSADWITEAPTTNHGVAPLAPVASTTMTGIKANGVPLSQMNPSSLESIGLYNQSGQLMAAPVSTTKKNSMTVNTIYGTLPSSSGSDGLPPAFGYGGGGYGFGWGSGSYGGQPGWGFSVTPGYGGGSSYGPGYAQSWTWTVTF